MHPKYKFYRSGRGSGLPILRVQHHYAHILSCMTENDCQEPVIGVSFDGTGYGMIQMERSGAARFCWQIWKDFSVWAALLRFYRLEAMLRQKGELAYCGFSDLSNDRQQRRSRGKLLKNWIFAVHRNIKYCFTMAGSQDQRSKHPPVPDDCLMVSAQWGNP